MMKDAIPLLKDAIPLLKDGRIKSIGISNVSMQDIKMAEDVLSKEGLLGLINQMALKYNIDKSQIPILWAIAKGAVPIVGITKKKYAELLVDALRVSLEPAEIDKLSSAAAATGIRQQGVWEPQ
ncbi:MAG: hypothetical protein IJ065_08050 [Eubacterium sp.]|nr:hypothetical protein [Eubacterium sp.]